jgi:hypothetical protein
LGAICSLRGVGWHAHSTAARRPPRFLGLVLALVLAAAAAGRAGGAVTGALPWHSASSSAGQFGRTCTATSHPTAASGLPDPDPEFRELEVDELPSALQWLDAS